MTSIQSVSPQQLADRCAAGRVDVVDVRTPLEYRELHAAPAKNVSLDSLDPHAVMQQRNGTADQPLYVICKSGARASKARQKFIDAGFENVVNVEGGTDAWAAAGLPVVRGKKTISLERQVRIAAGLVVLIGALLGIFVHPYFAGIAAFVGAGLMVAGVTDTCAMGVLLASMPWNQDRTDSCCAVN